MPDQSEWDWTAGDLMAWYKRHGYTTRTAPLAIGCGRSSFMNWIAAREKVPSYIAKACQLITDRIEKGAKPDSFLPDQADLEEYLEESEA